MVFDVVNDKTFPELKFSNLQLFFKSDKPFKSRISIYM